MHAPADKLDIDGGARVSLVLMHLAVAAVLIPGAGRQVLRGGSRYREGVTAGTKYAAHRIRWQGEWRLLATQGGGS
ncbi:hypothetical protein [Streptomyces sp. NPDC050704]|uniref:hypothetical protein n=1 Tax=Streptomyces sp. NPDC050704 TaxID=3157219 RepID=UPI0034178948